MTDKPLQEPTDAKARLRADLLRADASGTVAVSRDDLAAVLADLGDLRQRVERAEKAVRSTAEDWSRKGMPLGRYFANYAADMWMREAGELRALLGMNPDAYRCAMERAKRRNADD